MGGRVRFWKGWLLVATVAVGLFGLVLVVAPAFGRQVFGLLIYRSTSGIEALGVSATPYISLVHGVLGATMFGWAIALGALVVGPFARGSWHAWLAITVSLAGWFVADTALSLATGFWPNAVLNLAFAVLFGIPLAATFRSYSARRLTEQRDRAEPPSVI
jgi:hypothetical protein